MEARGGKFAEYENIGMSLGKKSFNHKQLQKAKKRMI
jgi:hypothetical protein